MMSGIDDELIAQARFAMTRAYAPYSGFRVGAALESEDGSVFLGCNVENSSYPVGTCAERVALGNAITSGATVFRRIAIATHGSEPASPCGMCRQALAEFGIDLEVVSVTDEGDAARWSLTELLPHDFRLDAADSAGASSRRSG
jgi:cytidine deaminase